MYLDFLDILLTAKEEDGNCLSKEDTVYVEVDTFLFEVCAIFWILYSLAKHPDHQKKCQEEIDRVVSEKNLGNLNGIKKNTTGSFSLIREREKERERKRDKLEYLTKCIKEGMRLHYPVPGILRINQSSITVNNHVIPARSTIVIHIYSLHHNAEVWGEDHMKFKPERFTKENMEKRDSFAFCPFSAGPR
ncbi:cytochrome P450 4F5-like [Saccostrea cucullata]|uniref:cytochrome P450 4F5-like n=1 Tax=Saccostrea cuccullata TaxID=36930 RepID=UPI002ED0FD79